MDGFVVKASQKSAEVWRITFRAILHAAAVVSEKLWHFDGQ